MVMSNEELVSLIQAGEQEKMALLWDQVRSFVAWKAKKIMLYVENPSYAELDDLMQSGYLALVEAVNTYTPGSSSFLHWFNIHLKNTFAKVTGYRTKKARYEPSRTPCGWI